MSQASSFSIQPVPLRVLPQLQQLILCMAAARASTTARITKPEWDLQTVTRCHMLDSEFCHCLGSSLIVSWNFIQEGAYSDVYAAVAEAHIELSQDATDLTHSRPFGKLKRAEFAQWFASCNSKAIASCWPASFISAADSAQTYTGIHDCKAGRCLAKEPFAFTAKL